MNEVDYKLKAFQAKLDFKLEKLGMTLEDVIEYVDTCPTYNEDMEELYSLYRRIVVLKKFKKEGKY